MKCWRCGKEYDPTKQAAYCHGTASAHYPVKDVSYSDAFISLEPKPKPKQRREFQGDFRMIWPDDK